MQSLGLADCKGKLARVSHLSTINVQPTLSDYWVDIYARKRMVLLTMLAAGVTAALVSSVLPPLYEAKTVFYSPINITLPSYTNSDSGVVLGQAPFIPPTEEKAASIGIGILRSKDVFRKLAAEFPPNTVDSLTKNTDIKVSREFMLEVYVRPRDPAVATAIANRFSQIYQEFHANRIREHMQAIRDSAARELTEVGLRQAELRKRERPGPITNASPSTTDFLKGSTDERLRGLADRLRNVIAEASAQAQGPAVPVVVVEQAVPPVRPVFPLPILNTIVAALTGLVFGCYFALFRGMLSRSRRRRVLQQIEMPLLTKDELQYLKDLVGSGYEQQPPAFTGQAKR